MNKFNKISKLLKLNVKQHTYLKEFIKTNYVPVKKYNYLFSTNSRYVSQIKQLKLCIREEKDRVKLLGLKPIKLKDQNEKV